MKKKDDIFRVKRSNKDIFSYLHHKQGYVSPLIIIIAILVTIKDKIKRFFKK